MAKKKKKHKPPQAVASSPLQRVATQAAAVPDAGLDIAEVWRHPTLILAAIAVVFSAISIILAVQFHGDMSMGALREPPAMIMWGAIALTLFASYRRERSRKRRNSGT